MIRSRSKDVNPAAISASIQIPYRRLGLPTLGDAGRHIHLSESAHIMPRLKSARATRVVPAPRPSVRIVALPSAVATDTVPAPGDRSTTKVHGWSIGIPHLQQHPGPPGYPRDRHQGRQGYFQQVPDVPSGFASVDPQAKITFD
jgi:hypothetical protein